VRNLRAEYRLAPGAPLDVLVMSADAATRESVTAHAALFSGLARVAKLAVAPRGEPPAGYVLSVVAGEAASAGVDLDVGVALTGQIDVAAERARIGKDIEKTRKDLAQSRGKLGNQGFVDRAPPEVVETEKRRLAESEERIVKLEAGLKRLEGL
jgi:valyl-tRNA synthetase